MNRNRKMKRKITASLAASLAVVVGAVPVLAAESSIKQLNTDNVYKEETVYAVSYTHLDVYKRQALDYVIRLSLELQIPTAINISFGNSYGSHGGDSLISTYINTASSLSLIHI